MTGEIRVAAEMRAGRTVVGELSGCEPWRPRVLAGRGPGARVLLTQTCAALISGDAVSLSIAVGRGAVLVVEEIAATLAHDTRGGPPARVSASIDVADGGRLVWLAQPLIAAAGCRVERRVDARLADGGVALLGETVVLGRAGEDAGALWSRTRITVDGTPLLDETLDTSDRSVLRSAVVAGDADMLATIVLAGRRAQDRPSGSMMQAHGPATVWRATGPAVEVEAAARPVRERWQRYVVTEAAAGARVLTTRS